MAMIRKYRQHPQVFVPDVGEVIMARRTPAETFLRAVVLRVRRLREGHIRVTVEWMEGDPDAGITKPWPIVPGGVDRITFPPDRMHLVIRQTS